MNIASRGPRVHERGSEIQSRADGLVGGAHGEAVRARNHADTFILELQNFDAGDRVDAVDASGTIIAIAVGNLDDPATDRDGVVTEVFVILNSVDPRSALDRVVATTALDQVVSGPTGDNVGPRVADDCHAKVVARDGNRSVASELDGRRASRDQRESTCVLRNIEREVIRVDGDHAVGIGTGIDLDRAAGGRGRDGALDRGEGVDTEGQPGDVVGAFPSHDVIGRQARGSDVLRDRKIRGKPDIKSGRHAALFEGVEQLGPGDALWLLHGSPRRTDAKKFC